MRYLFRGLIRDTGKVVEGHVEAATEDAAYNSLAENGIVTESLRADPKPLNLHQELPDAPHFANALDSAFDSSSMQVPFDELTERYRGKRVWVIDRDKIRRRVAQVVDAAMRDSGENAEDNAAMRQRVQTAISGLFNDNRNIASERNAADVAREQAALKAGQQPATQAISSGPNPALEEQVVRISKLVQQAEVALAAIQAAARRGGWGGGGGGGGEGGGPRRRAVAARAERQNEVLLEIFKSNLELQRGEKLEMPSASPSVPAPPAPPPVG